MGKISAKGFIVKQGASATPTDVLPFVDSVGINVGDVALIETTTHDSTNTKDYVDEGLRDTSEIEIVLLYDPTNAQHEALRAAHAARTPWYMTLVSPDSGAAQWAELGRVLSFNVVPATARDPLKANVRFKATGAGTFTQ
jgi:hypothetical protein